MTQIRPQGWARRVLLWQVLAEGCVEKKALVATVGREYGAKWGEMTRTNGKTYEIEH